VPVSAVASNFSLPPDGVAGGEGLLTWLVLTTKWYSVPARQQ